MENIHKLYTFNFSILQES